MPSRGTAAALLARRAFIGTADDAARFTMAPSSSKASRKMVSTSSDENSPMNRKPVQAKVAAAAGFAKRRAKKPAGTSSDEASSNNATSAAAREPGMAGTMRTPM